MQHFALSRKRSQRSKRQPDDESNRPTGESAELDCVKSGSSIASKAPLYRKTINSQRNAPPAVQVGHPQLPFGDSAPCSDHALVHSAPDMMIGVALGSPRRSPLPPFLPEVTNNFSDQSSHTSPVWSDNASRPTRSRWKVFGDLFSKNSETCQSPPAPSPYQLHQPDTPSPPSEAQRKLWRPQPPIVKTELKDTDVAIGGHGCPRDWVGPEQLPTPQKCKDSSYRRKTSLRKRNYEKKQAKDGKENESPERTRVRNQRKADSIPSENRTESKVSSHGASLGASLLQVEIPSVELERYSVMFSSLLHPSQHSSSSRQPSPQRQPSLLARRQANLQGLQTGLKTDFEPPRIHGEYSSGSRTASPNKSPSFSLFPSSPTTNSRKYHGIVRERSPLQRLTSAPSPSKAKFDFSGIGDPQDQVIVIVNTPTEHVSPLQRSTSKDFLSDVPSPKTTPREQTARASPALSAEPLSLPIHSQNNIPQKALEAENSQEDILPKAAEISIARQISISRRQRQLLVPAMPKVAPQPVQPRFVDVYHGRRLHKSQHLVLEDA
ncbi:MAG: hypothetical protein L6R41_003798 [Letrouitia leprolyta]|nr:MAG: hypothetical protein L6R41_003798 [Letrouitia leprolyta]